MREIMWNSRDHVSCAQYLEVTYALKKLKNLQLYIILMPLFATCK